MQNYKQVTGLLALLLVLSTSSIFAQKGEKPKRLLDKEKPTQVQKFSSFQEYLNSRPKGNLNSFQTTTTKGSFKKLPFPTQSLNIPNGLGSGNKFKQLGMKAVRSQNGSIRWLKGDLAQIVRMKSLSDADFTTMASALLNNLEDQLRLKNPADYFTNGVVQTDELGYKHVRFHQTINGIPVWGSDLYMHFDDEGSLFAINGYYSTTIPDEDNNSFSSESAVDMVIRDLKAKERWMPLPDQDLEALDIDLVEVNEVYVVDMAGNPRHSFEIITHPNVLESYTYIYDNETQTIVNIIENHCSIIDHNHDTDLSDYYFEKPIFNNPNSEKSALRNTFFDASGTDLNGQNREFRVYQNGDGTYYKVWDLDNLNVAQSELPGNPAGGAVTLTLNGTDLNENSQFFFVTSGDNTWTDASGVSAHVNMNEAYRYFKDTYNRKAIDDNDQSIISVIHATQNGQGLDNAFWTGRIMVYGDGDQLFTPLAGAEDVAGHEMSHGVIQNTANLVYQFQPGALNESFADVFGVLIEPEDFLLGEDIIQEGKGIALRDLYNPDNQNVASPQPAHMDQYQNLTAEQDNGGVHINSGIPNRAAALIIEAIGTEKAGQIYYRALSNYLTRNSQFGDARVAVIQSAVDLYGDGTEAAAAAAAFDAVGITDEMRNNGDDNDREPTTGGNSLIAVQLPDGTVGVFDITNPDAIEAGAYEAAVARNNLNTGSFSQLTTTLVGDRIYFINPGGFLSYVEVATGNVAVFNDLFIQQAGDLWNAAISPDGAFVALTSAYTNDANIYIFNGESLAQIPLTPETTQEGLLNQTIQFPDVLSWSRNVNELKLAFDAYQESTIAGSDEKVGFWSMYEIDFASGKIYNLVPSQPPFSSIGNVTYSNTDPDIIAFNVYDTVTEFFDIELQNNETGEGYRFALPSYEIVFFSVTDGVRPTFAPADDVVAFTTSLSTLIFYVFAEEDIIWYEFNPGEDFPVYTPHWFVFNGVVTSTEDEDSENIPTSVELFDNYPNPFNPSTQIEFALPAASNVRLDVFNTLGQHVSSLVDGQRASGTHTVTFDAAGLSSGIYYYRLEVNGSVQTKKMMLIK